MKTLTLTTKRVCDALEIPRHWLHNWARTLPPFADRVTSERFANEYSPRDLVFFGVVRKLCVEYGIGSNRLAKVSARLHRCIPDDIFTLRSKAVFIHDGFSDVQLISNGSPSRAGIVIDPQDILNKVFGSVARPANERDSGAPSNLIRLPTSTRKR